MNRDKKINFFKLVELNLWRNIVIILLSSKSSFILENIFVLKIKVKEFETFIYTYVYRE